VVYEVERTTDSRRLAAKVLSNNPDRTTVGRFAREAQILARLNHPNLISISDIDITSGGVLYIVMELVNGSSLWQLRTRFGQTELWWGLAILRQLADALTVLHGQGIVHRDLKPENVLVTHAEVNTQPAVKLADFGISILLDDPGRDELPSQAALTSGDAIVQVGQLEAAELAAMPSSLSAPTVDSGQFAAVPAAPPERITGSVSISIPDRRTLPSTEIRAESPSQIRHRASLIAALAPSATAMGGNMPSRSYRELTRTGTIVGTPLYMAPELIQGSKNAQPSADIFSLGVMAFEVLTGQMPFERPAILARALREEVKIPPLRSRRPDLPQALAELLDRCLDMQPERRPSAQEAAVQLTEAAVSQR
jgi:serine/threonine protein kinase